MKKSLFFITGFFLSLLLFVYSANGSEQYDYSFARMSYVTGDVFIERASDMGYEQGIVNLPLVENDKLGTRDGRAEVHFGRKNYLRIDQYTHIDFAGLPERGDDQITLNLLSGHVYLRVNYLGRQKDFEIHTPDASFYILEEGLYGLKVVENSETEIWVVQGSAEAAGEEGSVLVEAEQRLVAANGFFRSGPEYVYASYSDNFAEWNRSRDDLHGRAVERTYLPSELYEYESELAASGDWVYEAPYGNVWVPRVYHHTWRPYYYGRWLWYPVCGWTWVPYASWGWCVSHYGRWHWRFGLGWYWIPTRSWGPAWVHWYHGYDTIGWCPVSYYGYPVVIQHNTFYGRWRDHYYPLHSRALTVIRKNQLQAPRISKVALSQSHLNRLGKISLTANQPQVKAIPQRSGLTSQNASKVLARSNIRKVGKSYASAPDVRSSSQRATAKITGSPIRSTVSKSGQSGISQKSAGQTTGTSRTSLSSKSVRMPSSGALRSTSPEAARARTAIKTYPSRSLSTLRSQSSREAGQTSRSSVPYPSRANNKEAVKSGLQNPYQYRGSPSRETYESRSQRSSGSRSSSVGVKVYPSRSSYSSNSSHSGDSPRSLSPQSKGSTSFYSPRTHSRYSSSVRSEPSSQRSFRSSSSYPSSSYRSSSQSPSRESVSSSRSSSSFHSSRSTPQSSRSSTFRSSPSRVSTSHKSSSNKGHGPSGSKSSPRVSSGSSKVKKK